MMRMIAQHHIPMRYMHPPHMQCKSRLAKFAVVHSMHLSTKHFCALHMPGGFQHTF